MNGAGTVGPCENRGVNKCFGGGSFRAGLVGMSQWELKGLVSGSITSAGSVMVGGGTDLAVFPEVDVGAEAWAYVQVEKFCMLESSVLFYVRTVEQDTM